MAKAAKLQTNFTRGELSPRIESRPDLAAFFNGAKRFENFIALPQGGAEFRNGTRFVAVARNITSAPRLIDFRFNLTDNFILELSQTAMRFYKDGAQIMDGGSPFQITTPWIVNDIFDLHYRQTNDVMYFFHSEYATRKLTRISDTNWTITTVNWNPPATFEADTDIGGSATLTPGATTGLAVTFTASAAVFLAGDIARLIIFGASRALITTFTDTTHVDADILDDFPDTDPIAGGSWFLRLTPGVEANSSVKNAGTTGVLDTSLSTWRSADVGKFVKILGGLLKITNFQSTTRVNVDVLVTLSDSPADNPNQTTAWTLEVEAWTFTRGFPQTGEFHEGRLFVGPTTAQPTTFWASVSDDFENIGVGSLADDALEHRLATRRLNNIQWMLSLPSLYIGTAEDELRVKGSGGIDEPLGGDQIPNVKPISHIGTMRMQPGIGQSGAIFVQNSTKKIYDFRFSLDSDDFAATDLTTVSEHITGSGIKLDKIAFAFQPNEQVFFPRKDGELVVLTYNPIQENVLAWSRWIMGGRGAGIEGLTTEVMSVAVIPHPDGDRDQVWVAVRRNVDGGVKNYIEYFDDDAPEFAFVREWTGLHTDSAFIYDGGSTTSISGLDHLATETVAVIGDGMFRGNFVVSSGGVLTLPEAVSQAEIGFPYTGTIQSMRPSLPGEMTEGLNRKWNVIYIRLIESIGANVNGEEMVFSLGGAPMDTHPPLFTGDKRISGSGWDTDGYVTVIHNQPYPLHIGAIFGEVEFAEWGDPSPISL